MAQNFWIRSVPSSGKRLGNHTPYTRKWPHHSRMKKRGHQPKKTNPGNDLCHHFSTLRLARADRISPPVYPSCLSDDLGQRPGPLVKCTRGLPAVDKHRPLWTSGSGGLRRLARRDVAVGTHAYLIVCTRVWNPSHRHLT
jgi:hypothetical protein